MYITHIHPGGLFIEPTFSTFAFFVIDFLPQITVFLHFPESAISLKSTRVLLSGNVKNPSGALVFSSLSGLDSLCSELRQDDITERSIIYVRKCRTILQQRSIIYVRKCRTRLQQRSIISVRHCRTILQQRSVIYVRKCKTILQQRSIISVRHCRTILQQRSIISVRKCKTILQQRSIISVRKGSPRRYYSSVASYV